MTGFDATPFVSVDEQGHKILDLKKLLSTPEGRQKFAELSRSIPMTDTPAEPEAVRMMRKYPG